MPWISSSETILNKQVLSFQMIQHVRVKPLEAFSLKRPINRAPPDM